MMMVAMIRKSSCVIGQDNTGTEDIVKGLMKPCRLSHVWTLQCLRTL